MKLYYWEGTNSGQNHIRNFGDELNPFIWKKLLGDVFDDDKQDVFIGIGSLLNDNLEKDLPESSRKIIFGTGVGYGQRPLTLNDTYKIYCVRGPLSAQALGISEEYAITDGALLIRHVVNDISRSKIYKYGYMPHWTNHTTRLKMLCEDQDIFYIDPTRADVMKVINELLSCEIIFAEAMHAAIIADALRVPWVPIKSTQEVIPFKWQDWCKSINTPYEPHTVWPLWEQENAKISFRHRIKELFVSRQLAKIKNSHRPFLSDAKESDILLDKLSKKLETLKKDLTK